MISEFSAIAGGATRRRPSDTRSPGRWIASHLRRHSLMVIFSLLSQIASWSLFAAVPVMIGRTAQVLIDGADGAALLAACLGLLAVGMGNPLALLGLQVGFMTVGRRLERDARDELYRGLLAKSQTFHNRQKIGDLMARTTDDTNQLNLMASTGAQYSIDLILGFVVVLFYVGLLELQLLLVPGLYVCAFVFAVRGYVRRVGPVLTDQRAQHGLITARAEETITGIEVVKAAARESWEQRRFSRTAARFRDLAVRQSWIEALNPAMLAYGVALGLAILHGVLVMRAGGLQLSELIAYAALMALLRNPSNKALFCFTLLQNGMAAARRILAVLTATTELDQNQGGHQGTMQGAIALEHVSFGYRSGQTALNDIDIRVDAGETLAIVGQTGSGKSALTHLVNRIYDPGVGRVSIDGVDLREWNLTSLRSQIANIEQDVFLFSRSIADNIAFARPGASQADIEGAARHAAAHGFITSFQDGYDTIVGERGITLSGGQRQRLALARAFLKDPRILILDDATSAIDSATEDEIQRALHQVQRGRTTLLITHRLSQIRWADRILVLDSGRIVANGTHDVLLATSTVYRRIFSHYDIVLPPLRRQSPATDDPIPGELPAPREGGKR